MGQDNGQYWDEDTEGTNMPYGDDPSTAEPASPDFENYDLSDVSLGDLMRGERATLGKSLLDVERELRIRATYIAAIENGDVGAFQSPGFIAGYVRSYARYLQMDPEWTFRRFCDETGFRGVHGFSAKQAAEARRSTPDVPRRVDPNEVMARAPIGFAPMRDSVLSRVEPGALGSFAVLIVLALGIGYGAWAVLNDIQRLQIAPVDDAPAPLAQLDPLAGATEGAFDVEQGFDIAVPEPESIGRLYRPQPLEAPVIAPRNEALATLDPDEVGTLTGLRANPELEGTEFAVAAPDREQAATGTVQVTETGSDEVLLFAVRPTWIRVTSPSGTTLFEGTLNAGDSYALPETDGAPLLRSGNAGSLYFAVNGVTLGPAGVGASIVRDVELSADAISSNYAMADANADPDLPEVAELVLGGQ
ncbi:DUF4115 domain-containing protein [Maritalea mobilis]|uniref:helix-turn-helix domain-containing protein n=1 Tax=Maritalea mobilis TaxID=483324 RepID=UPI001C97FB5F|nr:RodZ domain-containing protein [Maritalea mobilis]MBY6200456.1 DUF4115 domain-containing protein [Maritalea mobilis]